MSFSTQRSEVILGRADLDEVTRAALVRLSSPADDAVRAAHIRTVMQAALDLSGSLRTFARCGLVNGQGSHGSGDLWRETAGVFTAFDQFAALVRAPACHAGTNGSRHPWPRAEDGWRRAG